MFTLSSKASLASVAAAVALSACGGATRGTPPPQKPGTAALTGAKLAPRIQRVLVADRGAVAMVARGGCVASVKSAEAEAGTTDELRVRCPRPDRLTSWFSGLDQVTANVALERVNEEEEDSDEDLPTPAAELVTAAGAVFRVSSKEDASKIVGEVNALVAELAASEVPGPGPATPAGWQMVRVAGPAHVYFAGAPAKGMLDVRMSTTGQYFCDFVATTADGPMRATKSGWIAPQTAAHAIDEVLIPFEGLGDERPMPTFASGYAGGGERRASAQSTAAVFERFAPVQDALGDACLPELDKPSPQSGL